MFKFNFREQNIMDVIGSESLTLTKEIKKGLVDYYIGNYDRVRANIVDDELVGLEYDNLCVIEELVPSVKELKLKKATKVAI